MSCYSLFSNGSLNLSEFDFDVNKSKLTEIDSDQFINGLDANNNLLIDYSIDDLLTFFDKLSRYWEESNHPLKKYTNLGLGFIPRWLSRENLEKITNASVRNNKFFLDNFQKIQESDKNLIRAQPMGVIGHWIAGNIPILGMISLVQGVLTKNINVIRVSKSFGNIVPYIIDSFKEVEFINEYGKLISGSEISKSISVIYYDKDDADFANKFSQRLNVRVVWGGLESVKAISGLKKTIDTVDIIFGPKYSYSVIDNSFLDNDNTAKEIAQKLAFDVSAYEQRGCNSPHTVFVQDKGNISIEQFCKHLANGLNGALRIIPKEELDAKTISKILNIRAEYSFSGLVLSSNGTDWSVLYDPELTGIADPCYGRTIFVRKIDDIFDVLPETNHFHQSVGLAIRKDNKIAFAEQLSRKGISRCPDIGSMSLYDIPWDGMFPMEKMIRWVSVQE
jgi:hypothetical protein